MLIDFTTFTLTFRPVRLMSIALKETPVNRQVLHKNRNRWETETKQHHQPFKEDTFICGGPVVVIERSKLVIFGSLHSLICIWIILHITNKCAYTYNQQKKKKCLFHLNQLWLGYHNNKRDKKGPFLLGSNRID